MLPGFSVSGDSDGRWPVVMASPHSGRDYPPAFLAASRLSMAQLRRAEDPLVDALLEGIGDVPVLTARHGRAFLDLNRAEDELDPAMYDAPLPITARQTERVGAGLGVVPRVAAQGLDIYRRRMPPGEAEARLAALHRPWHARIAELLARARARHGFAILIDCHSMPQPSGVLPPQIVLGDRYGGSASPALMSMIEGHFQAAGWRVGRNIPYAGGHTTAFHGAPGAGIHAVQVEIDRGLYVDTGRMTPTAGFAAVASAMTGLAALLVAEAASLGLEPPLQEAAE
ncbi:N-formylglutamate amidohydrolase [Polymorphobacter glacialis]|uniref:N-formylglutamate amidohydrolase n=2 Tax=Sandarakinorhabdus glacialis TaxID=1614636 RepID=A0A916ZTW3_9SPHN|nr:N-formylglutamate amidohydrolase [Polymorphobacter glacialis]